MKFTVVFLTLLGLAAAANDLKHEDAVNPSKSKPAKIVFTCMVEKNCDEAHMKKAIFDICKTLGGKQLLDNKINVLTSSYNKEGIPKVTGGDGICLCATGNWKPTTFLTKKSDPTAMIDLIFGLGSTYGVCPSAG